MEHVKKVMAAAQPLEAQILRARELYEAGEDTGFTDAEYDALEAQLRVIDPLNPILKQVGSPRAGKVPLPYPMNGISQVQVGEFDDWRDDCARSTFVVSDKLDGVSVLLHYHDGIFVNAFSRGNGSEGANVSRHILKMTDVPRTINSSVPGDMFIRAEVIMAENIFDPIKAKYGYVTARNFVAGQMNRETAIDEFYRGVSVLAYSIYVDDKPHKATQTILLRDWGFYTPKFVQWSYNDISEASLIKYLIERRELCPYAIDGLVITVDSAPDVQAKFKVTSDESRVTATVESVQYSVSKSGYLKPTIHIAPVQCGGVTVSKTTGYNAGYIRDNGIGPGAIIKIERRGEVVPTPVEIVSPAKFAQLPEEAFYWTDSGVDAIIATDSQEIAVQQMVHCFKTLGVFGAGEGNIRKIMEYGNQIVNTHREADYPLFASERDWTAAIGANGSKIYKSLQERLSAVSLECLGDALGTFGRGVGTRTLESCSSAGVHFVTAGMGELLSVPDVAEKTAERIIGGQLDFVRRLVELGLDDKLADHLKQANATGSKYAGLTIEFTGVRDKDLENAFIAEGGKVGSKFSILVAKDPSANSGKLKKAREKGVEIITLQEARKRFL